MLGVLLPLLSPLHLWSPGLPAWLPADCPDVSPPCNDALTAFNLTKLTLISAYHNFSIANQPCARRELGPCWTDMANFSEGRLAQGTCVLDCAEGLDDLTRVCTSAGVGGSMCHADFSIGTDGTSFKIHGPACLPLECTSKEDTAGITTCLKRHTCETLPKPVRQLFLPECDVTFGCSGPDQTVTYVFIVVLSLLAVVLVNLILLQRKLLCYRHKDHAVNEDYAVLEKPLLDVANSGDKEYELSDSLAALYDRNFSHTKVSLVFRNLFCRFRGRTLIRGVSGYVRHGESVCVIGAPDSGASTLLQCLASRHPSVAQVTGTLMLNGLPPDEMLRRHIAYIPKEDVNLPTLTVRETLQFSTHTRLGHGKDRDDIVQATLQVLGLAHVSETIVGDQLIRGISGGEKRRVSIGVESVAGSSIIIADSPTNGLDSAAALKVISASRALCKTGRVAFVASVRQPSEELLCLFDTCCLMSRGTCLYWGPVSEAVPFLESQGFVRPPSKSVPDFLEEMTDNAAKFRAPSAASSPSGMSPSPSPLNRDNPPMVRQTSVLRKSLLEAYRESDFYAELGARIWQDEDEHVLSHEANEDEAESKFERMRVPDYWLNHDGLPICCSRGYATNPMSQVLSVLGREWKLATRSPTTKARIGRGAFLGILLGTMFFQLNADQEGAMNRYGLLFTSCSAVVLGSTSAIPELAAHREIFYKQRKAGYFRARAYHVALFVMEVPLAVVEQLIYSLLLYGLCGLNQGVVSWNFFYFWLIQIELSLTAWSVCLLGVFCLPSVIAMQAIVPVFMALMILFSGYLIPLAAMPSFLKWLYYVSLVNRPFKGMVLNEMLGQTFFCQDEELVPPIDYPGLNTSAAEGGWNGYKYRSCPIPTGATALKLYDMDTGSMDKWSLMLSGVLYLVIFQILILFAIHLIDFSQYTSDDPAATAKRTTEKSSATATVGGPMQSVVVGTAEDDEGKSKDLEEGSGNAQGGGVEFRNLGYSVDVPGDGACQTDQKQLLTDISGYALEGTMMALMGASGAGKSTLLDVLADKKTGGTISGDIFVNNAPRDAFFPRFAGYVEQMDSHVNTQTVREAVYTSALLRLPAALSAQEKAAAVDKVVRQLFLLPFQHQMVGGVSPEIRKKVTIAVELVADPIIMFLDEPTTGLDSASALAVAQTVRAVCESKAVICTIHQPSMEVFSIFDWLLLLQKGGRVAYFGPVGRLDEYFQSVGLGVCPSERNPADFALDCSSNSTAADLYDASAWKKEIESRAPSLQEGDSSQKFRDAFAASSLTQFQECFLIQWRSLTRDKATFRARFMVPVVFALIVGMLFFQMERDQAGAKTRISMIFISIVFSGNTALMAIPWLVAQRPVYFRERSANTYRFIPYYAALVLAELPLVLVSSVLYTSIAYPLTGLRAGPIHFLRFLLCQALAALSCFAFAHFVNAFAPNADTGTIMVTLSNSVFILFCGFMLPYNSIPIFWKWLYYLSLFRYPLGFMASNELLDLPFHCEVDEHGMQVGAFPIFVGGATEEPPFPRGAGKYSAHCLNGGLGNISDTLCWRWYCPVQTGQDIIDRFSFPSDSNGMYANLFILLVFFLALRLLGGLAMRFVQHIKR